MLSELSERGVELEEDGTYRGFIGLGTIIEGRRPLGGEERTGVMGKEE